MRRLLFVLLFGLLSSIQAQEVVGDLVPSQIPYGQSFELVVRVGADQDPQAYRLRLLEILRQNQWRVMNDALNGETLNLRVESETLGYRPLVIPRIDGEPMVFEVQVLLPPRDDYPSVPEGRGLLPLDPRALIEISPENRASLLENQEKAQRERARAIDTVETRRMILLSLAGLAVLAVIAAIAWRLWQRWIAYANRAAAPVIRGPRAEAIGRLRALEAARLPEQGDFAGFYLEATGIVRVFMEEQYGLRAPERTTEEFLAELTKAALLSAEVQEGLKAFLRHADLVKYARAGSSIETCQNALNAARAVLESR